jgi:hypothetical protein
MTGTYAAVSVALVWVVGELFEWRGRALGLAAAMAVFWVWYFVGTRNDRRDLAQLENELRASGVVIPDEEPIRVKLAESTESLVVSIILLVLIAAVFVAYHVGWLHRVGFLR